MKIEALLKSRRFWVAVFGVLAVALHETIGLDPNVVEPIAAIAITWIVGDTLRKTE